MENDWMSGLFKLVQGAQTDPKGTALRAAMSGVDPSAVEQILQMQAAPAKPGQATGALPSTFDNVLNGPAGMTPNNFSQAQLTGSQEPKGTTLPQVGATADRLPYNKSPLLQNMNERPGNWQVMDPGSVNPAAFEQSAPPGLTQDQTAKLLSMIPQAQVPRGGGGGGGGFPPHQVKTGNLTVNAIARRPGFAELLRGGR